MPIHLRIAPPVSDLGRSVTLYLHRSGLVTDGQLEGHESLNGVTLAHPNCAYYFEVTFCHTRPAAPAPTADDLCVFNFPELNQCRKAGDRMLEAGSGEVAPFNPYWRKNGCTFEDHDGYRLVLEQDEWNTNEFG